MEPVYKNLGKVRPTIDNNNWSINNKYDLLTIVYDPSSNKSYISRKDVPANIIIDNREYWLPFGIGKFVDNAIININYLDGVSQELITYTLKEAIARISDEDKRLGVIISFYGNEANDSHTPGWCLYQFMSNDLNDWDNVNAWNSIYHNRNKNVGWFRTESELLAIYPYPHKGDYCYIGISLISSFVYRCYENGTWVNTHELASANIGIIIGGNIRISENGTWIVDDEDTGIKAVGTGIEKMTYTPSQEDGGINIFQIKLTDGTQFSFPIKNGNQGNSGIIVPDLETFLAELVNNLTTDDGTKALSAAQGVVLDNKISQLGQAIQKSKNTYSDKEDDVLYIADALGHIVAQIDKDGIKAINLIKDNVPTKGSDNYVKSGGVYTALMNAINTAIHNTSNLSSEDNTLYIADSNGYIVMKVSKDGLRVINQFDNSIIYKKKIIGVGDSLSVHGYYEKELCRLGNAIFNGVYSAGGTNSLPNNLNSSQDRVKKLIEDDVDFDIIIFENINDRWRAFTIQNGHHVKKGNISDNSFMLSQYIDDQNVYATLQEAQDGFTDDFSTIVAGVSDKKAGSVIQVEYQTETIVISVDSVATSSGDIQVAVGENVCSVSVTPGMTTNAIAYYISQYNFEGYEVQRSNNIVTLNLKSGYTISTPSFDTGNTGVTISYTNGTSAGYYRRFFTGYSIAEFIDISNWSESLSLYSLYKGIIEYIQENKPQAKIVFFAPSIWGELPQTNIPSSLTNPDGSYNITKILDSDYLTYVFTDNKYLREIQKDCAELYGCIFIDAMVEGGISPFNISEYYNSADVHPKDVKAYNKWGELIFNKLN